MADAQWSITRSKRKSTTRASTPRKRTKRSDTAATNRHPSALQPQQTLTQIAFVTSSSFEDDDPLLELDPPPQDVPQRVTERPPRTLKRDSTLTQMSFGSSFGGSGERRRSSMQPPTRSVRKKPKKRDSTLTQMDFFHGNMDGTAEFDDTMLPDIDYQSAEPQAIAPAQSFASLAPATPIRNEKLARVRTPETQEYQPGKRKLKQDDVQQESGKRRRSSRIAAAVSPAVDTTFVRPDTMAVPSSRRRTPATVPRRPLLEIQDSTEFLEEPVDNIALPQSSKILNPSTPTKNLQRIPSSQTPESIRRSAAKQMLSPSKASPRRPLAELSTNLRMSSRKTAQSKARKYGSNRKNTVRKSPSRKICVLKVPKVALASIKRGVRVEDLEHDIYSLQPTSPLVREPHSSPDRHSDVPRTTVEESGPGGGPTIKETASSQRNFETQESLPDISDILGIPPRATVVTTEPAAVHPVPPSTPLRYPTIEKSARIIRSDSHSDALLNQEPLNMIPELEQISTDELSDLGSPMANDTQFVKSLQERLSSPVVSSNIEAKDTRAATVPRTSICSPNFIRGLARASFPGSSPKKSPLPAPKLVHTSPARKISQKTTDSSGIRAMPYFSTQNRSFENVKTVQLPLNDTLEYQQLSSSPKLPQAPLSSTQKSTQPASIPRPSQISTQAPSQGYFPSSSAPQALAFPHDTEIERITIKDSSSFPARLSQIVQHLDDESELEGDLDLFEGSQDEDDLDLDPSTLPLSMTKMKSDTTQASRFDQEDITQTPTQKTRYSKILPQGQSSTQSSPIVTNATTRSQRDAKLEVVALTSSSSPSRSDKFKDNTTPKPRKQTSQASSYSRTKSAHKTVNTLSSPSKPTSPPSSSLSSSLYSPSPPRDLKRKYSPIPGFNNDTQSDFTQGGSVTAAYVHRMWDRGELPRTFVPKPYKVKRLRKE